MHSNNQLKITTKKSYKRFIQTDNLDTFFTISDFKNKNDGLWFKGIQLFNSITIENAKKIESKALYPASIEVTYSNKFLANLTLFKKGNGFIIEIINKKFISKSIKNYNINFNLNENFQILEKNIKNIILEYTNPKKETKEYKKIYCVILINIDYNFDNVKQTKEGINFFISSLEKSVINPEFYIFYHDNYNEIKNILEINVNIINILKKEHLNNSLLPLKHTNCQTNDKIINKALFWSIISSANLIYFKNTIYNILSGIPKNFNFQTINTFISLTGTTLTTGLFKKARNILYSISKFQCNNQSTKDYGKIPDFIEQSNKLNYLLDDSTPLFIRSIYEYYLYTDDNKFIKFMLPKINLAIEKVYLSSRDKNNLFIQNKKINLTDLENYQNSLYLPRNDISIETQALWYTALYSASKITNKISNLMNKQKDKDIKTQNDLLSLSKKYKDEANKLRELFIKYFISKNSPYIYDHLNANYSSDNNPGIFPLLAFFYSSLPGIPSLIDKNTLLNFIKLLMPNLISNEIKDKPKYIDIKTKFWLFNKLINIANKYSLNNFIPKYISLIANQILENDTLGTLNEYVIEKLISKEKINEYENFSYSSSISEFSRTFYQDYLGIKFNIANRKIYIEPTVKVEINNIETNIRFGFNEGISYHIRFNKKSLNTSYIEIKSLKILKPISIILKINLGFIKNQEKIKYKYTIIKLRLNKKDDSIKISFEQIKPDLIKLKEFTTSGSSIIYGINYKSEIFD